LTNTKIQEKEFELLEKEGNNCIPKDYNNPIHFIISIHLSNTDPFFEINSQLLDELIKHINKYNEQLKTQNNLKENPFLKNILKNSSIQQFIVQKYVKNQGKIPYHNESFYDLKNQKIRILQFIWFLNDVEQGGGTEFFGEYKIQAKQGKFILFPVEWFFAFSNKIAESNDQYIITGWIYSDTHFLEKKSS